MKYNARQTQKRIFRAFRRAYLTGRKARYLQFLYTEYREMKARRDAKAKKFCKFYEQAERIYRRYKKEFMVATESEKHDFETERNRLQAIGRREEVIGGITGITRARA